MRLSRTKRSKGVARGLLLLALGVIDIIWAAQDLKPGDQTLISKLNLRPRHAYVHSGYLLDLHGSIVVVPRGTKVYYEQYADGPPKNQIATAYLSTVHRGRGVFRPWHSVDGIAFRVAFLPGKAAPPNWTLQHAQQGFADVIAADPPPYGPWPGVWPGWISRLRTGVLMDRQIHPFAIAHDAAIVLVLMMGLAETGRPVWGRIRAGIYRRRARTRRLALHGGRCPVCHYVVAGLATCPECGELLTP